MKVCFLLPAQYELDEAIDYYNAEVPELGNAFLLEALAARLEDEIVILAVAHLHRKPDYWRSRLSQ